MGINQSKDNRDETRSCSSSNSSGTYKLFGRRSGRPFLFKASSASSKEEQENKARQAALRSFKEKQALKKQKKLDKKNQQLEQQYKQHHTSSTITNNSYASQQGVAQQHPLPTPPSSHHHNQQHHQHQPTRRLSHSTDSISSSGKSSSTHQSSGRSGSSFQDMTLEERLHLLNLTGVRGSPSAEKTAYSKLNFVGDEQEINRQLRYVRVHIFSPSLHLFCFSQKLTRFTSFFWGAFFFSIMF